MPNSRPAHSPSERTLHDHKLVRDALSYGEEKTYSELTHRYQRAVYMVISKMIRNPDDIEDLAQQTFAKAFNKLSSFNPEYAFATWILRIATNECIAFLRIKKLSTVSIDNKYTNQKGDTLPWLEISDSNRDPQEELIYKQKLAITHNLINQLPDKYKLLIHKHYLDNMTCTEIAQEIQIPIGTVKARMHSAKLQLLELAKMLSIKTAI